MIKPKLHTFLILLAISQAKNGYTQISNFAIAGTGHSLGFTWISLTNPWSGMQNRAALANQREFWVGAHHENRFMLTELGSSMLGIALPVKPGTFGVDVSHFGFSGFNTGRVGLGYGMYLGKRFTAGIGLAYTRLQLPADYRSANAFTVEGGIHYTPTERLTVGFYVFNPTSSSFDDLGDLPTLMGIGLTYNPSARVMLVMQVDDDTQRSPAVRCGLEYRVMERTALRLGYSAASPEGITVGIGFPIMNFDIDLSLSHHQTLGFTPSLSVAYLFRKKEVVTQ